MYYEFDFVKALKIKSHENYCESNGVAENYDEQHFNCFILNAQKSKQDLFDGFWNLFWEYYYECRRIRQNEKCIYCPDLIASGKFGKQMM